MSPIYLLQEPPKHIAWLNGGITNVNRNSGSYTSVTVSNTEGSGTTSSNTSGWDIANTVSISAQASLSEGNPALVGGEVSVSDKLSLGYERSASEEKTNSQTTSVQYTAVGMSQNDDYVQYNETNYDVWRYRIYGSGSGASNQYKFYEVVVPGQQSSQIGDGSTADWYNPSHENGNILSYAPPQGNFPVDVGPPYLVDNQPVKGPNGNDLTNGVMWSGTGYCVGNASTNETMQITGATTTGHTVNTNNTMQQDNELQVGMKTSAFGLSESQNFDWTFGAKESWGSAQTSTNNTSSSTTFAFYLAAATINDYAYNVTRTLYNALSGAIKITYSVNIPTAHSTSTCGDSSDLWTTNYAIQDPGFLMPFRWDAAKDSNDNAVFALEKTNRREQLKSFFLESVTPNPIETTDTNNPVYDKLASIPSAGTQVRLSVPVYNFSVGAPATNVAVRFSTIPVDGNNNETGCGTPNTQQGYPWVCPDSYRTPLKDGETSNNLPDIQLSSVPYWSSNNDPLNPAPPNWVTATTTWTIPSSLGPSAGATKYRIYANIVATGTESNPPQAVCTQAPCKPLCSMTNNDCTSPDQNTDPLAPGQNDEGWTFITIGQPNLLLHTSQPGLPRGTDVHTTDDSLAVIGKYRTWTRIALGFDGQPMNLRVKATANVTEDRYHRVAVTDRSFKNLTPKLIAGKILQGVSTDGTAEFFTWTPQTTGVHQLQAELQEFADDTQQNNNKAGMLVFVLRAPGDLDGSGFVDSRDLSIIEHETGKTVQSSDCGYACDLNGDGLITKLDQDLLLSMCSLDHCATPAGEKATAISMSTVQEQNQKEIAALRNLKPADWDALIAENGDQNGPELKGLYLNSLQRIVSGSTAERSEAGRLGIAVDSSDSANVP